LRLQLYVLACNFIKLKQVALLATAYQAYGNSAARLLNTSNSCLPDKIN